ncbi:MAG: hypothetical protein RBR16_10105 [Syntrophus sp. (in: bacteria)]|nr:hypothetical protein [Syntrophus sp. (in: bacteria)]
MKVYVNGHAVSLMEGMTVRHALLASPFGENWEKAAVHDEWGNEVGMDGALQEGQNLHVTFSPHDAE